MAPIFHESGVVGLHGDGEAVEGIAQSESEAFDIGFLAGPAAVEGRFEASRRQFGEGGLFVRAEEARSEFFQVAGGGVPFDIDAEWARSDGDEGEIVAVRDIEVNRVEGWGKFRFSIPAAYEFEAIGGGVEIVGQDYAQCAARDGELVLGWGMDESGGPLLFSGREQGGAFGGVVGHRGEAKPPDMDMAPRQDGQGWIMM